MPRRRGGAAPSRPMAAPARSTAPPPQQKRAASTAAYPGAASGQQLQKAPAKAQQQTSQGPGLLGQMASTAAGVAIGSTIGHAIGGMFGGGSTAAAAEDTNSNAATNYDSGAGYASQGYQAQGACMTQISTFKECMDKNQSDLNICGFYLDQLKRCQEAASKY